MELTIQELKYHLKQRNMSTSGKKIDLINRLIQNGGGMDAKTLWTKYQEPLKQRLSHDTSYKDSVDKLIALPLAFKTTGKYKKYLQWMVESYLKEGIRQYKDIMSLAYPAFDNFMLLTNKGLLQAHEKDINQYCGITGCKKLKGLDDLIDKYKIQLKQIKTKKESRLHIKPIYTDHTVSIYQPITQLEAVHLGQGTKWCTASKNNNKFDYYNTYGSMYVVVPKKPRYPGEKYQLYNPVDHPELHQNMDEEDDPIDIVSLLDRFPMIKKITPTPIETEINIYWRYEDIIIDKDDNIYKYLVDTPLDYLRAIKPEYYIEVVQDNGDILNISYFKGYGLTDIRVFNWTREQYESIIRKLFHTYPQLKDILEKIEIDNVTYWLSNDFKIDNIDNIYLQLSDLPINYILEISDIFYEDKKVIMGRYQETRRNFTLNMQGGEDNISPWYATHVAYIIIYNNIVYVFYPGLNDGPENYKFYQGDTTVNQIIDLPSKLFKHLIKIATKITDSNLLTYNIARYASQSGNL